MPKGVILMLADVNMIEFDPEITDVVVSFFAVAGKYAMIFGIMYFLIKMLTRVSTGKERLL